MMGEGWGEGEIPVLTELLAEVTPIPRFAGTSPVKGEEFAYPYQPVKGEGAESLGKGFHAL